MPWLTIIMTLLSYFMSKKSGASDTQALLTAGLVGAGTYYTTHETDWGKANLGSLDGVTPAVTAGTTLVKTNGSEVVDPATGQAIKTNVPVTVGGLLTSAGNGTVDVLKSWGATGTAAVIGTAAAASSGLFSAENLKWWLLGGSIFLLMR